MRTLGFFWGVGGVVLLLAFAIWRLAPMALALDGAAMDPVHWAALLFSVAYMAYAEGYRGFHQGFAPRVVARARRLRDDPRPAHVAAAPLYCMGFVHATRRRRLLSIGLTAMIVGFVLAVRLLPQPWRGILDAGVVAGLSIGVCSIGYFLLASAKRPELIKVPADMPDDARDGSG